MSLLSAAENVIKYGTVLGLVSDKIGLTGKGGLVHDVNQDPIAEFHEDELEIFEGGITIPWSNVSSIDASDADSQIVIKLVGGLELIIPYGRFAVESEQVLRDIDACVEDAPKIDAYLKGIAWEGVGPDEQVKFIKLGIELLEESRNVCEMLDGTSGAVGINEYPALDVLCNSVGRLVAMYKVRFDENKDLFRAFSEMMMDDGCIQLISGLVDYWAERIAERYPDDTSSETADKVAYIKYCLRFRMDIVDELEPDMEGYALGHSVFEPGSLGYVDGDDVRWLRWFDEQFCSLGSANGRKWIVCTDEKRGVAHIGENIDGVAIIRPYDLQRLLEFQSREDALDTIQGQRSAARAANHGQDMPIQEAKKAAQEYATARKSRRLVFEEGHPRNGVTYVQHPMRPNTYIDIESFHSSMLERKYNELIGVLTELGAREITCSVENTGSTDSKYSSRRSGHFEAGKDGLGNLEVGATSENAATRFLSLYKKLDTHLELRPTGDRRLPDDLIFYPFEEGWQRLAKEVLTGRLLKASFDLTYRKDYAITGKYVKSLSAKIESMIPACGFNAGGGYERELEEELKELESTTWHYEVDFGETEKGGEESQATEESVEVKAVPTPSSVVSNEKAESVILGRAKRYAKTEEAAKSGLLTDAQRADLEKLASKYGIDEFRLEELIDEAFA